MIKKAWYFRTFCHDLSGVSGNPSIAIRLQILFQERRSASGLASGRSPNASFSGSDSPPGKVNSAQLTPGAKERCVPAPTAIFRRHSLRGARSTQNGKTGFSDTAFGPARHGPVGIVFAALRPPTKSP